MFKTHGKGFHYQPGGKWKVCPRCGFDVREKDMVVEYTGKKLCKKCEDKPPETRSKKYGG